MCFLTVFCLDIPLALQALDFVRLQTRRLVLLEQDLNQLTQLSSRAHALGLEWPQAPVEMCYLKSPLLLFP